jgi:multiple sugar transport system permease protein
VILLSVMMVPKELFLVPQFEIINKLQLHNTIPAVVLPHLFSVFGVFLMRQYFRSIPTDIEDAARLDGAGPLRAFWSVMLPLGRSGIITLALFAVLSSWNGLLWPLIVIDDPNRMPLTAGLATLQGETFSNTPVLLAGSLMANLPLIVLFVLLQRQFIQGIALGGTKG